MIFLHIKRYHLFIKELLNQDCGKKLCRNLLKKIGGLVLIFSVDNPATSTGELLPTGPIIEWQPVQQEDNGDIIIARGAPYQHITDPGLRQSLEL